jgi:UDP-N-acetyl-D-mannosaminuronic acid dehydrogenase
VDPWFFVEAAPELTPLIYNARRVNDEQPHYVLQKVKRALGALNGKKIVALGLAYKPDVDDLRESPATEVVHLLQEEGAQVRAWEPFKPNAVMNGIQMAPNLEAALQDADLLLLLVRHTEFLNFDPKTIASMTPARLAVDCVNGWDAGAWSKAGFQVFRLGANKIS